MLLIRHMTILLSILNASSVLGAIQLERHQNFGTPPTQRVIRFIPEKHIPDSRSQRLLSIHARFLKTHPEWQIQLQGHTDERNNREYNIAVGEQNAKIIANQLIKSGVLSERLQIISFGEEHPLCKAHTSSCWQRNRRVQLLYVRKH